MADVDPYDVTPAALRPLMQAYWSPEGWRAPPHLPVGDDLARAVCSGLMFERPVLRDHEGWVDAARRAAAALTLEDVAQAFIGSLTSRRLDLRSALGSYAVARHLPEHAFVPGNPIYLCGVCGVHRDPEAVDVNERNFERFKWGGVQHDDLCYVAFDLEQFARAPKPPVDQAAVTLGRQLFVALADAGPRDTAASTAPRLQMVKGNAAERRVLLEILGVCGVLATSEHPGYLDRFVPHDERQRPSHHFVDDTYPVCWWRGSDGVNTRAVRACLAALA